MCKTNSCKNLLIQKVLLLNLNEENWASKWLNIHLFLFLVSQTEVTVNMSPGGGPASAKHENHALSKPTPGSQLSPRTAEVLSCDKNWLQEATQEFITFSGAEQVHSYRGIPVHSQRNTSFNWDNAWLTCWTSHLVTHRVFVFHCCVSFHRVKGFTCMNQPLYIILIYTNTKTLKKHLSI